MSYQTPYPMLTYQPTYQTPYSMPPMYPMPQTLALKHKKSAFRTYILPAFLYAIIICSIIILCWYYWAMYIYRYSLERLANLALAKFSAKNVSKINKDGSNYFNYDPATIKFANNILSLDMLLKDKKTQNIQSRFSVTYKYSDDCDLLNFNCIR